MEGVGIEAEAGWAAYQEASILLVALFCARRIEARQDKDEKEKGRHQQSGECISAARSVCSRMHSCVSAMLLRLLRCCLCHQGSSESIVGSLASMKAKQASIVAR